MPTPSVLRLALIGFGKAGRVFHAPLIAADPRLELSIIVTSSPERTREAARRYPDALVVATVDQLWSHRDRVDAVVVATPNDTHAPIARAAALEGIAVVVDKPLASSAEEAGMLVRELQDAGVPLSVFQNRRWDGDFLTVAELVRSGALGEVHDFESRFSWWAPEPGSGWKATATPDEGGGSLYDMGPHLIDQAIELFGPVVDFHAEMDRRRPEAPSDDDTFVSLLHHNGVRSRLWMSSMAPLAGPRFRLTGSLGGFMKFGRDPQERQLASGITPTSPRYGVDRRSKWGVIGHDDSTHRIETQRGDYPAFYRTLASMLLDGGPNPVDPRDSVRVLTLIDHLGQLTTT